MRLRAVLAGAVLLPAIAGCATASAGSGARTGDAAYAWAPGDTLRYDLATESSGSVGMQEPRVQERRRTRIALAPAGRGRARAWVEEARVETPGAETPVQTAGPEVTGRPFLLAVGRLGVDSVAGDAPLPWDWAHVRDELRSLLPRLPGGPLSPGRTWGVEDQFDHSRDTAWAEPQTRSTSYRVVGDSALGGVPVVVVEYEETRTREVRRRGPAPPPPPGVRYMPPVVLRVWENEEGRFYFDARSGRLVRLSRTLSVEQSRPSYTSAEAATQSHELRQTLELLSAAAPARR